MIRSLHWIWLSTLLLLNPLFLIAQGPRGLPVDDRTRDEDKAFKLSPTFEPDINALRLLAKQLNPEQESLDPKLLELAQQMVRDAQNDPAKMKQLQEMIQKNSGAVRDFLTPEQKANLQKLPGLSPPPPTNGSPNSDVPPAIPPKNRPGGPSNDGPPSDPISQPRLADPFSIDRPIPKRLTPNPAPNNDPFATEVPPNDGPSSSSTGGPMNDPMNAEKAKQLQGVMQFWEQSFGSLDDTPAVKQVLFDMMVSNNMGMDKNGKPIWADWTNESGSWNFWDSSGAGGKTSGLMKWLDKNIGGTNFKFGKLGNFGGMSSPKLGGFQGVGNVSTPSVGSFSIMGLGSAASMFVIVLMIGILGVLLWKFIPALQASREPKPQGIPGLGPWPIDPRDIRNRDSLVIAFDYLSVLTIGNNARSWNHITIGQALTRILPHAAAMAEPLSRLYELARYSASWDPFTTQDITEARGYLCQLAGVSPR